MSTSIISEQLRALQKRVDQKKRERLAIDSSDDDGEDDTEDRYTGKNIEGSEKFKLSRKTKNNSSGGQADYSLVGCTRTVRMHKGHAVFDHHLKGVLSVN